MSDRLDQVRALYASTLQPRIDALDGVRRELKTYIIKSGVLVGVPFLLFFIALQYDNFAVVAAAFLLILVGIVMAAVRYLTPGFAAFMNYKVRFKREVVAEVFRTVVPSATYEPLKGMSKDVFDEAGIFNTNGGFSTDDRVSGRIGNTPFEAAEVARSYQTGSGKSRKTVVVFQGLFFQLDLDRILRGTTIVEPERARFSQIGDRSELQLVSLDHSEFEHEFKVYSSDAAEARDLLSHTMRERLLALGRHTDHPVFLAFRSSRAFVAVHYGRPLFEPRVASTTSLEAIEEIANHFELAEVIVRELELNVGVAYSEVSSRRFQKADQPADTLDDRLTTGNLKADDVWRIATEAVGVEDEADAMPRPPGSRVDLHQVGQGAEINYGFSFGFFVAVTLSLLSLGAVVNVGRILDGQYGPTALTPLFNRVPPWLVVPIPPDAVFVVLIPAAIVGAMTSLFWLWRVRRVAIQPDAILIWRGLRPFAKRYRRPEWGRVLRIDNSIYIGRTAHRGLINPTASPLLASEDEAKWVASEMHRALRR